MPHDFRPLKGGWEDLTGICKRISLFLWALNFLRLQVYERAQHLERSFTRFKVYTIDCLEAELNGKKVVKSDEWEATHNYRLSADSPIEPTKWHTCAGACTIWSWILTDWSPRCMTQFKCGTSPPTRWPIYSTQRVLILLVLPQPALLCSGIDWYKN